MKRFFALFMVLCFFAFSPLTAFAVEEEPSQQVKVSYVGENVNAASTRTMTYNQVWIDAGEWANGSFGVENPHPFLFTTTNGTLTVESNNPDARVHIVVHDGIYVILDQTIGPGDGEVLFSSQSNSAEYVVSYFVYSTSRSEGIRINCWLY